jgi:hypothetical protein
MYRQFYEKVGSTEGVIRSVRDAMAELKQYQSDLASKVI